MIDYVIVDRTLSWKGRRDSFSVGQPVLHNGVNYEITHITSSDFQKGVFNASLKEIP